MSAIRPYDYNDDNDNKNSECNEKSSLLPNKSDHANDNENDNKDSNNDDGNDEEDEDNLIISVNSPNVQRHQYSLNYDGSQLTLTNEVETWRAFQLFFTSLLIPYHFIFSKTIPNPISRYSRRSNENDANMARDNTNIDHHRSDGVRLAVSFVFSIIWLALLTLLAMDLSNKIGSCLGIKPDVMGITLLAVGSSIPDTFSSILVSKQGKGTMAMSNVLSSNIFDICVCIGLSYLFKSLIKNGQPIAVEKNLAFTLFTIFIFVLLFIWCVVFIRSKLLLTRVHGWCLIGIYIVFFVAFVILLQHENEI